MGEINMKKIKKIGLIIVLSFAFILQCGTVLAVENMPQNDGFVAQESIQPRITGEITGNGVRIRKTASTSGTVLGLLYRGDVITVHRFFTNSSGEWAFITTSKGIVGYVSADYVAI